MDFFFTFTQKLQPNAFKYIMGSESDTLQVIPNGKPVRIFIPLLNKTERLREQCVYQETQPPRFSLLFMPDTLPVDDVDTKQSCIISIDMGGPSISLEARIEKITSPATLEMIIQKSINHDQLREFFRVDTETNVISKSFQTSFADEESEPWAIQGKTIDISGSGILAVFSEPPPADKKVRLEIILPTAEPERIKVLAHPVRICQQSNGSYEVAYHFDEIATEDRDKIIGCCLVIQRKLLRLKVQVKDI